MNELSAMPPSPNTLSKSQTKSQIDRTPGFNKFTPKTVTKLLDQSEKYSDKELNHLSSGNIMPDEMKRKRSVLKISNGQPSIDVKGIKSDGVRGAKSPDGSIQS